MVIGSTRVPASSFSINEIIGGISLTEVTIDSFHIKWGFLRFGKKGNSHRISQDIIFSKGTLKINWLCYNVSNKLGTIMNYLKHLAFLHKISAVS